MKSILLSLLFSTMALGAQFSTLKVGDSAKISADALFETKSTTLGARIAPAMTATQRGAISSPGDGLLVYDTTIHSLCEYNSSLSAWDCMVPGSTTALTASKVVLSDANGLLSTGTPSIAQGGTGQTTKQAAFDALSPNTAKGDITVFNGTNNVNQAAGSNGQVLTADSTQTNGIKWAAGGGGGTGVNFVGLGTAWTLTSADDISGDASVGNWLAYADAAGTAPVDMTGGSPNTTCLRTTTAGHILDNAGSLEIVKAGSANRQGEGCSVVVNIPPGYRGQNAQIQIPFSVFSGTYASGDMVLAVYDVTNSVLLSVSGSTISGTGLLQATLVIPSSTAQIRMGFHIATTTTQNFTVDFDDVILGPPNNIGIAAISNDWIAYTATFGSGWGTVTGPSTYYKRVGDTLFVQGNATSGTTAGSLASLTLPTGLTIDTTKLSSNTTANPGPVVGFGDGGTTDNSFNVLTALSTSTSLVYFGGVHTGGNGVTPQNGSTFMNSSEAFGFFFHVPITQWSSTGVAFKSDQLANSWSGYHDNTCSWARTNTGYGDPTADASCTLQERVNRNFGTVSTYTVTNAEPGIVFTPSRLGTYHVCAHFQLAGSSLAATVAARLWDGTTTVAEVDDTQQVATDAGEVSLCGLYKATSIASTTLSIQTKASAGSATIASAGTSASAIEWEIFQVDQQMPMPFVINTVNTSATGTERVERANMTCSSSSAINSQSGGFTSIGNIASGKCSVVIPSTTWNAATYDCSVLPNGTAVNTINGVRINNKTTTGFDLYFSLISSGSSTIAAETTISFDIKCMGPH